MKSLLNLGAVGLLTSALLDPLIRTTLEQPVIWWRDLLMACGGIVCLYLLVKYRRVL